MTCCGTPPTLDELDDVARLVSGRLTAFIRTLRDNAFAVGMKEGQDAVALIAAGYARRPGLLRTAFKHLFAARRAEWERFDGLFDAFWLGSRVRSRSLASGTSKPASSPSMKSLQDGAAGDAQLPDQRPADGMEGAHEGGEGRAEGASQSENLAATDFRKIADPAEMARAHALAADLAQAMRTRLTRRDRSVRHGSRLDLRRTIHRSISHGGVPLDLMRRQRRHKPLRLVILLDASASMSMYTSVFLRFAHGVLEEFAEAEAFLFHTRLAHVSDAMKERDAARALDRLSMMAQGAGGGTRIGECLAVFNRHHAARVIHSRTCVMIVSDGYETGDASLLGREMAQLHRRCRRIVWLNPMMGWDGYAPEAAGIRAALPHVELMAPAHTLDSLAALEPFLAKL